MKLEIIGEEAISKDVLEQLVQDLQNYSEEGSEIRLGSEQFKMPVYPDNNFFELGATNIANDEELTEVLRDYDGILACGLGIFPNLAKIVRGFDKKRNFLKDWLVLFVDKTFSYLPDIPFVAVNHGVYDGRYDRKPDSYFHNFSLVGDLNYQTVIFGGSSFIKKDWFGFKPVPLKFNGWILATLMKTLTNEMHMLRYLNNQGSQPFSYTLTYVEGGYIKNLQHHLCLGSDIQKQIKEISEFQEMMETPIPGINCPPE